MQDNIVEVEHEQYIHVVGQQLHHLKFIDECFIKVH